MTEMEKMKAGLEYCFTDKELIARKSLAIVRCEEYNAIDGMDRQAQYEYLKQMLVFTVLLLIVVAAHRGGCRVVHNMV